MATDRKTQHRKKRQKYPGSPGSEDAQGEDLHRNCKGYDVVGFLQKENTRLGTLHIHGTKDDQSARDVMASYDRIISDFVRMFLEH